jgi:methylated-DNA-protein-cysteine methyltransferase-like protein
LLLLDWYNYTIFCGGSHLSNNAGVMKSYHEYDMIYSIIMMVPRGKVATYGQIAEMAGLPGHARQVGYALRVLPDDSGVPWHRIVNSAGEISRRFDPVWEREQRLLLEGEGIEFNRNNRLSLAKYQWKP